MSADPVAGRVIAGSILLIGLVGGLILGANALSGPAGSDNGSSGADADRPSVTVPTDRNAVPVAGPSTLILYDPPLDPGDILEHSPEVDAIFMANLAGHFGPVETAVVSTYEPGDGLAFDGVVYVGAWGDNPIPPSFISDVVSGAFDVLWLGAGTDQLAGAVDDFAFRFGWEPVQGPGVATASVRYKDVALPRAELSLPLHQLAISDVGKLTVLATSFSADGGELIYALRSANITYVAEVPFAFLTEGNNSLVVADLLFDLLDPSRPERHQALVRLEDIGPTSDPDDLRATADELHDRGIPFTFSVYPRWRDPLGRYELGTEVGLADRSDLVEALEYLESRGGTMIMHGVSHQHGEQANPDSGVSGEDFEFYLVGLDDDGNVATSSPVPGDSAEWVRDRIEFGFQEFELAGLDAPTMFEFPHYLASPVDYQAVAPIFDARYERSTYFPGLLSGAAIAVEPRTQYFPYPVHDVYGEDVVPENLGNVSVDPLSGGLEWGAADVVAAAERMMVVRDGVASFFFHPFLGTDELSDIVDQVAELGYDFVSVDALLEEWR